MAQPDDTPPAPGKPATPAKVKIQAKDPVRRDPVESAVYDLLAPSEVSFAGTGINNDPRGGHIRVRPYRMLADGTEELGPLDAVQTIALGDPDAMAASVDDQGKPRFPKLRALLEAFEPAVEELALARGLATATESGS